MEFINSEVEIDLSIVILNWNTKQLLLDCIESIITETKKCSYEIIVVDNASIDDSVSAVKDKYPNVKLIRNTKNEGFARGNNIGISQCRGRYICLSNTDIKVLDHALDRMYLFMQNHPRVGMVLPKLYDGQMRISLCCRDFPSLRNLLFEALFFDKLYPLNIIFKGRSKPPSFYRQTGNVDTVPLCFTMVKSKSIKNVGMLDERFFFYGEDLDWCKRFNQTGWKVVYFPGATVIHFGGASTAERPFRYLVEKSKTMLQFWHKHHGYAAGQICRLILTLHYFLRVIGLTFIKKRKDEKSQASISSKRQRYLKVAQWLFPNR